MLEKLTVRTFKSLEDVTVDLGRVNVFIGANGSGKSNLLEALGILAAAADGRVDDQTLLARGVRPGLPALYKCAFPARAGERIDPHLRFGAAGAGASYEVSLHNPLKNPAPAWRFKTERWKDADDVWLVGCGPRGTTNVKPELKAKLNPERGLAALRGGRSHIRCWAGFTVVFAKLCHFFAHDTRIAWCRPRNATETSGGPVRRKSSTGCPGFTEATPVRRPQQADHEGATEACGLGQEYWRNFRKPATAFAQCGDVQNRAPVPRSIHARGAKCPVWLRRLRRRVVCAISCGAFGAQGKPQTLCCRQRRSWIESKIGAGSDRTRLSVVSDGERGTSDFVDDA